MLTIMPSGTPASGGSCQWAADDVPRRGGDRGEQQIGAHALVEGAGQDERIKQQRRGDDRP
jgi:hypothetical protein